MEKRETNVGNGGSPTTGPDWQGWFERGVRRRQATLWRGVEAQHVIATMRLVDTPAEQSVLEALLEKSKPPLPPTGTTPHYLLSTPYRYRPPQGTRFTRPAHPGIWYGAEELETACAEVAHWRWRFLTDNSALTGEALHTEHTFFQAGANGRCIDLGATPWRGAASLWTGRDEYRHCRALADAAAERNVDWIRYQSVRRPDGRCGAVLNVMALSLAADFPQQTWACKTTREAVFLQHAASGQRHAFEAGAWQ
jgi:hypothetical protein